MSSTKFHDSYWGDGEKGFEVCERLSSTGLDVLSSFVDYLEERADAEEQFAKRLRKLQDVAGSGTSGILHTIASHTPVVASGSSSSSSSAAAAAAAAAGSSSTSTPGAAAAGVPPAPALSTWSADGAVSAGSAQAGGLPGIVANEPCKGLRDAFAATLEEARQQFTIHKSLAASFSALATEAKEALKDQKASRKAALSDAVSCLKERTSLESQMKKAKLKYAESVAKKEAAVGAVAAYESQNRAQADIAKMKAKMHKLSKEEMVLDQELKEAVEELQAFHPAYVARMTAFMDTLQRKEEQRAELLKKLVTGVAAVLQQPIPTISEAASQATKTAAAVNVQADFAEFVRLTSTGSFPTAPPQYVARSSRAKMADATIDQPAGTAAPLLQSSTSSSSSSSSSTAPDLVRSTSSTLMTSQSQVLVIRAKVLYQFIGEEPDEIDLLQGEIIPVLSSPTDTNGWWVGKNYGRVGWFPASYVQEVKE